LAKLQEKHSARGKAHGKRRNFKAASRDSRWIGRVLKEDENHATGLYYENGKEGVHLYPIIL